MRETHEEKRKRLLEKMRKQQEIKAYWAAIAEQKHKERLKRKKRNKAARRRERWRYYYNYLRRKNRRHIAALRRRLQRQRTRYRLRVENERLQRFAQGDTLGRYYILLTVDKVKKHCVKTCKWKRDAYEVFRQYAKEHNDDVWVRRQEKVEREVILVETVEYEDIGITRFLRDEMGKLIAVETNKKDLAVIDAQPIFKEEYFSVFGANDNGQSTGKWIYEHLLETIGKDVVQVCILGRLFIIKHSGDIDIVVARNKDACVSLYVEMEKRNRKDNIIFTGTYNKFLKRNLMDVIQKKTQWSDAVVKRLCS